MCSTRKDRCSPQNSSESQKVWPVQCDHRDSHVYLMALCRYTHGGALKQAASDQVILVSRALHLHKGVKIQQVVDDYLVANVQGSNSPAVVSVERRQKAAKARLASFVTQQRSVDNPGQVERVGMEGQANYLCVV